MALVKGTNAYATVAEGDTYLADRLDVAAWVDASAGAKAQALITAADILDRMSWTGYALSESQAMAFPRSGIYFDPRIGSNVVLDATVPTRISNANIELAYHLLNNDGIQDDTGKVLNISVGPIKLDTVISASLIPKNVKLTIKPLLVNQGSNPYWRAN